MPNVETYAENAQSLIIALPMLAIAIAASVSYIKTLHRVSKPRLVHFAPDRLKRIKRDRVPGNYTSLKRKA